jgi:hypothetical protein
MLDGRSLAPVQASTSASRSRNWRWEYPKACASLPSSWSRRHERGSRTPGPRRGCRPRSGSVLRSDRGGPGGRPPLARRGRFRACPGPGGGRPLPFGVADHRHGIAVRELAAAVARRPRGRQGVVRRVLAVDDDPLPRTRRAGNEEQPRNLLGPAGRRLRAPHGGPRSPHPRGRPLGILASGRPWPRPGAGLHGPVHPGQEELAAAAGRDVRRRMAHAAVQPALRRACARKARVRGPLAASARRFDGRGGDPELLHPPAGAVAGVARRPALVRTGGAT